MSNMTTSVLTQAEMESIFQSSLEILQHVGMRVCSTEALDLFSKAGCDVSGDIVKVPEALVRRSIESAPANIDVYDRNGEHAMALGGTNSFYGPGVTCPYFIDPHTGERKESTAQNVADVAKVSDALKNIDFAMSLCMISDCPNGLADIHEMRALITNTTKPICSWSFNRENMQDIIDICASVRGSYEALAEKPYLIVYSEPTSPLVHTKEALEKLMLLARYRIPCVYSPGMTLGATAPVTIAGALSVGMAEALTGLILSQIVSPGAPMILSANASALDMRSMQIAYGSPEQFLTDAAATQIYRWLGIPTFGLAGATDAKTLDAQAILEFSLSIAMAAGSGANLVHDLGMTDIGMTGSLLGLVICEEIVQSVRRLSRGIEVDEGTLCRNLIEEVGHGGNFIAEEHTVEYLHAIWSPELSKRQTYAAWRDGGATTLEDRARAKMLDLLKNHVPQALDERVASQIDAIVSSAEARCV